MWHMTDEEMINRGLCTWCIGRGCEMCDGTGMFVEKFNVANEYACLGGDDHYCDNEEEHQHDSLVKKENELQSVDTVIKCIYCQKIGDICDDCLPF